jgi:hypothetical protein
MGINSTEVSYGFGQMGSILHESGGNPIDPGVTVDSELAAHGAVFVAITFLEDSIFESAATGLVAEDDTLYLNSTVATTAIDTNGGIVTDSVTFPKGITIYGRWTKIDLNAGKCIAYIGH